MSWGWKRRGRSSLTCTCKLYVKEGYTHILEVVGKSPAQKSKGSPTGPRSHSDSREDAAALESSCHTDGKAATYPTYQQSCASHVTYPPIIFIRSSHTDAKQQTQHISNNVHHTYEVGYQNK